MIKNASSSTPMRPAMNIQKDPYVFSDDALKSPSNHVSMDVSNIVTPYQTKIQQEPNEKRTKKWSIDDFNIGRRLGEGSFSTVILVEEKKTGFLCALKVIKKSIIRQYQQEHQLIRELEIHMRLFHKHILRMYDFFYDSSRIYVILEYAANDTLASYLKHHQHLDNIRTATFIYQIADALSYCHRLKIMHRDLKPENILLGQFHEIKLADFGLALHCPSSRRTQYIGTMDYMAPEVIENEDVNIDDLSCSPTDSATKPPIPYEESADLWSLGIITYELLAGTTPFYDTELTITKKRILSCNYVLPGHMHMDAGHFISHLLKYDRLERLTIPNVFEHSFIRSFAQINFLNETLHRFASMHHSQNNPQ
ncbi:unnamed protein product [Rotaria magnacalcarata]|uniref:Aurora kinase n=2 Tax=Rotaria magnacalcarata TaxID=392030 RepID=A0A816RUP1_9BILA|nr:unnamed protein product [Rotaria magnacalcarata]CAF1596849.1 unnamed protein product [Rotaria magnacalcarata]CAF2080124.1 unnamed protein product [Rotaria magnacalcarata]CAF3949882.1 unnamed protein product [Rotaria magnacalcarata]CAF4049297.1 unnamed protein product [Rotaria magnacalcarata]